MRICQGKQHTLMGETRATCLPACVSYTLTSPWLLPAQMYSPLLVAEKPQASAKPARALHPGTCACVMTRSIDL